jgi:hypothetical protein
MFSRIRDLEVALEALRADHNRLQKEHRLLLEYLHLNIVRIPERLKIEALPSGEDRKRQEKK